MPPRQPSRQDLFNEITRLKGRVEELEARCAAGDPFSTAFRHAPLLMTLSTVEDGRYIDVNDAFERVTGYTREEAVGVRSVDLGFIPEGERERLRASLTAGDGRVEGLELELRRADGRPLVCSYSGAVVELEGEPRLLSLAVDVTERRQTALEREASIRLLRMVSTRSDLAALRTETSTLLRRVSGCERATVDLAMGSGDDGPTSAIQRGEGLEGTHSARSPGGPSSAGGDEDAGYRVTDHGTLWTSDTAAVSATATGSDETRVLKNIERESGHRSVAVVPLCHEDHLLGRLCISDPRPGMLSKELVHLLERLAASLSLGLAQRRDSAALASSEARFRAMFEKNLSVQLLIAPEDGRIVAANPAAVRFYGYGAEALTSMSISEINTLPDEEVARQMEAARRTTTGLFHFRHRLASGEMRDVEVHSSPVPIEGEILLFSIIHDITERRSAELELERLRSAMEQTADAIVVTDREGVITYVNPAFERVTGYARDEVIGENPRILKSGVHDEAFYQEMWDRLTSGATWQGRLVNRRGDGSLYTEEATISPVVDRDGTVVSYVGVKRDVTREIELEAQLQHSQRMESVGLLAGGIAHDFNNLLQVMSGYCEIAQDEVPPPHPAHEILEEVLSTSERAAELIDQLLAFSGRQTLRPAILDLNQVVADLGRMVGRVIGEHITLEVEAGPGLRPVEADRAQVEQAILSLCVNARDAMGSGGSLRIRTFNLGSDELPRVVAEGPGGGFVGLSVSDTGAGMDEEVRRRALEPFFTTKAEGRGSGLGLSTVYGIARQHGGRVEIESASGEGTTVTIYLPVAESPRQAEQAPREEPRPQKAATILVAEDDPRVRRLFELILQREGHRVLLASDGEEAVRIFTEHADEVELVILDVVMPNLGGRGACERIRRLRADVPVLFATGYSEGEIDTDLVLDQGLLLIKKPFQRAVLVDAVQRALGDVAGGPGD